MSGRPRSESRGTRTHNVAQNLLQAQPTRLWASSPTITSDMVSQLGGRYGGRRRPGDDVHRRLRRRPRRPYGGQGREDGKMIALQQALHSMASSPSTSRECSGVYRKSIPDRDRPWSTSDNVEFLAASLAGQQGLTTCKDRVLAQNWP